MGVLEQRSKKRAARNNVQKLVLKTIKVAGVLSLALVAPNVLGAMMKLGWKPHKNQKSVIARARDTLLRKGLVQFANGKLRITDAGSSVLRRLDQTDYARTTNMVWDGKWRIIIFDIPEPRRKVRIKLRRTLHAIGFVRLQDSVWVFPYNCEDLIALLKADFRIGKDLLYIIADEIESDYTLRKHFNLK